MINPRMLGESFLWRTTYGCIFAGHGHELSRKLGIAKADFESLRRIWNRSSLHWRQKLEIYRSVVESKLLYSLCALVLTKQEMLAKDCWNSSLFLVQSLKC